MTTNQKPETSARNLTLPHWKWYRPIDVRMAEDFSFAITTRLSYRGRHAGPLLRLALHGLVTHGRLENIGGGYPTEYSDIPLGFLGDHGVSPSGSIGYPLGSPRFRCSWRLPSSPAPSEGFDLDTLVFPRPNFAMTDDRLQWYVGSPLSIPCIKLNIDLHQLIAHICEKETGTLSVCGHAFPSDTQLLPPASPRITWRTYFQDPFHGSWGSSSLYPKEASSEGVLSRWVLHPSEYGNFSRVGVLVSASPAYLAVADNLSIVVDADSVKGSQVSCRVPLGELRPPRRSLPGGWVGSSPFSLPFSLARESVLDVKVTLSLVVQGDAEAGMIRELEAQCVGEMKEEDVRDYLFITLYLIGEECSG